MEITSPGKFVSVYKNSTCIYTCYNKNIIDFGLVVKIKY